MKKDAGSAWIEKENAQTSHAGLAGLLTSAFEAFIPENPLHTPFPVHGMVIGGVRARAQTETQNNDDMKNHNSDDCCLLLLEVTRGMDP